MNKIIIDNTATEKGGRNCFNEDFVLVGDFLNPGNLRLLIQSLYRLLITNWIYGIFLIAKSYPTLI